MSCSPCKGREAGGCKDALTQETVHVPVTIQKLVERQRESASERASERARRKEERRRGDTRRREKDARKERTDDAMRLSPIILSWATASWLGPAGTAAAREGAKDHELSTEFFLVPGLDAAVDRNGLASVASVISVPAPNRTVSVHKLPPGRKRGQAEIEADTRAYPRSLLRQRPWALPLAALSAATMLLMAGFEVFVLLKVGSLTFNDFYSSISRPNRSRFPSPRLGIGRGYVRFFALFYRGYLVIVVLISRLKRGRRRRVV